MRQESIGGLEDPTVFPYIETPRENERRMKSHWSPSPIRYLIVCAAVTVWTALLISCTDTGPGPDSGDNVIFPDSNVSYSQHVETLFQQRCAFSGCHAGAQPQAGLDLTRPSYSSLRNHVPALVVAGEGDNSLLVQILDGRLTPRMPFNREPLNQNQINGIKTWIDEGAVNN